MPLPMTAIFIRFSPSDARRDTARFIEMTTVCSPSCPGEQWFVENISNFCLDFGKTQEDFDPGASDPAARSCIAPTYIKSGTGCTGPVNTHSAGRPGMLALKTRFILERTLSVAVGESLK
jgi:hypothetical protein